MPLNQINKIVITPGHGAGDPGAVSGDKTEASNNIKICQYLQELANTRPIPGCSLEILDPNNTLGLQGAIDTINNKYEAYANDKSNNVLAIEIHQDMNAPQLPDEQENTQMGVYYFANDNQSLELADELSKKWITYGAYHVLDGQPDNFAGTWRRGHYLDWAGYYLGFVNFINCWSIIIENGYISGRNSDEDLRRFAVWIYKSLYEVKTGQSYDQPAITEVTPIITPPIPDDCSGKIRDLESKIAHLQNENLLLSNDRTTALAKVAEIQKTIDGFNTVIDNLEAVIETKAAKIKTLEVEANLEKELVTDPIASNEKWSWDKFFISLSRNGTINFAGFNSFVVAMIALITQLKPGLADSLKGIEGAVVVIIVNLGILSGAIGNMLKKIRG